VLGPAGLFEDFLQCDRVFCGVSGDDEFQPQRAIFEPVGKNGRLRLRGLSKENLRDAAAEQQEQGPDRGHIE
jgi:hypothetical protein